MRFASLGSGSRGNGTLIEAGRTTVLLDCGFSLSETRRRLALLGRAPEQLSAIVVTHEHSDHIGGVERLARHHKIPVYATPGTARHAKITHLPQLHLFNSHETFSIGDLQVQPFPVPHDAWEPAQFVFSDGQRRLGVLTDVGCWTPHIETQLNGCDALLLECNHDIEMLISGRYPPSLKQRVGGRHGHLSNAQAAELLSRLEHGRLQHLVAAHLSEENNRPQLAQQALAEVVGCEVEWIGVALQDNGLEWRTIS